MAEGDQTRTAMGDKSAVWSQGDRIALYAEVSSSEHFLPFDISATDVGAATAGFTLDPNYTDGWNEETYYPLSAPDIAKCVAIYPQSSAFYYSPYSGFVRLGAAVPANQTYIDGSFDNLSMPMIATSTETATADGYTYSPMNFKYMGALIHLTMTTAAQTELDKIELSCPKDSRIAGVAAVEFNSKTPMTDAFKAVLQGGEGSLGIAGSASFKMEGAPVTTITMNGPISLSNTPSNAYFSVLPLDYSAKELKFTFYHKDGVKTEKTLTGNALKAGEIAQLPALAYNIPFLPVASVSENLATWTLDEAVENYSVEIRNNGNTLRTITEKNLNGNVQFDPTKGIGLDTVNVSGLNPGTYTLQFVVKADFKDKSGVNAAYSVPVEYTYNAKPVAPAVNFMKGANMLRLLNFQTYWTRLDYAMLQKKEAGKEDFANVTFHTVDGVYGMFLIEDADIPEAEGDYTYAVRAWYDTSKEDGYTEGYAYVTIEPTVQVTIELSDEDLAGYGDITIVNAGAIIKQLGSNFGHFSCYIPGEGEPDSEWDKDYWQDAGDPWFFHVKTLFKDWNLSGTYELAFRVYDAAGTKVGEKKISVTL